MKRVLVIFGTRPEAIKMAPLVQALVKKEHITVEIAVTGQHRGMLDQVLDLFELKPKYDLNIMKQGQDLFDVTANALMGLRNVFEDFKPDMALVHGDTTTCLAGALAAFYMKVPVGHVEAGLRTGNINSPFPEEANRTLVGSLATYHFAPTQGSRKNLLDAGVPDSSIWVTGNTVIDALLDVKSKVSSYPMSYWETYIPKDVLDRVCHRTGKFILMTGHRRENFGEGFLNLCNAIRASAIENPDWLFVYPVHLNPNVQKPVYELLGGVPNVILTAPLDYLPFVWLLDQCDLVITDSGGLQEEAPSLGKPVLVTRETTERPEAVDAGTVILVGTSKDKIISELTSLLGDQEKYNSMARSINPYGDGKACQRIVDVIESLH